MQNLGKNYNFKVITVGDPMVGKSTLLLKYISNKFDENITSTIGVDFKIKPLRHPDKNIRLHIWDTAGQERFRSIISSYFRSAHAILIIYDVTDKKTFDNVFSWFQVVEANTREETLKVIVGNKTDLEEKRVVEYNEAKRLADNLDCFYFEVSSKSFTDQDMQTEMFDPIVDELLNRFKDSYDKERRGVKTIALDDNSDSDSDECCDL